MLGMEARILRDNVTDAKALTSLAANWQLPPPRTHLARHKLVTHYHLYRGLSTRDLFIYKLNFAKLASTN